MIARLRAAAHRLQTELDALAIASRDPRVSPIARAVVVATVAYALSPIDLIPDVIPVLGLLDDLILVPLGLWLALRLVSDDVMAEARAHALAAPTDTVGLRLTGFRIVLAGWIGMVGLLWAVLG